MPDETCDAREKKPLTKPCARCGKLISYSLIEMSKPYCEQCLSHDKSREYTLRYYEKHPEKIESNKEKSRIKQMRERESKEPGFCMPQSKAQIFKHDILYDEPCFFCEFGCCSGTRKIYITISGKTIEEELGIVSESAQRAVKNIAKINMPALLDRNRFIVCCSHHAAQILNLRRYHEEWDFDDVIEEVIHRCK